MGLPMISFGNSAAGPVLPRAVNNSRERIMKTNPFGIKKKNHHIHKRNSIIFF